MATATYGSTAVTFNDGSNDNVIATASTSGSDGVWTFSTGLGGGVKLASILEAAGTTCNFTNMQKGGVDLATETYVDNAVAGLKWIEPVYLYSTTNVDVGTGGDVTIDSVSSGTDGKRILLTGQTTASEDGVYTTAAGAWSRASDFGTGLDAAGIAVFVQAGTNNGDKGFVCTDNTGSAVVGTDDLTFAQFTGGGVYVAGDGLADSSNTFSVNVDDTGIEINADTLRLKDNGVTLAKMAGIAQGGVIYGNASGDPAILDVGGTDGGIMIGDGNDVAVQAVSGVVTLNNGGVTSFGANVGGAGISESGGALSADNHLVKAPCAVATTASLSATAGGSGVGKTLTNSGAQAALSIDGVTMAVGDRVLVKNQSPATHNGIYTVTIVGTTSTNWELTRATDADESSEVGIHMLTHILEGTTNGGQVWALTTTDGGDEDAIAVDTDTQTFTQHGSSGGFTATGNGLTDDGTTVDLALDTASGLTKTKNTDKLAVNPDTTTIEINGSDQIAIVSGGVDTTQLADDAVTLAKLDAITEGSIIIGGASNAPSHLDVKSDGQILIGNGTTAAMQAVSGVVTLNNGGVTSFGTNVAGDGISESGGVLSATNHLVKAPCRVATTANLNATASGTGVDKTLTNAGADAALTIDGVSMAVNDRVLVKDQTNAYDNGIYFVETVGTTSTDWVLKRATDADEDTEVDVHMKVHVIFGTVNANTSWVMTNTSFTTVDTASSAGDQDFTQDLAHPATLGTSEASRYLSLDSSSNCTSGTLASITGSATSTFQSHTSTSDARVKENVKTISVDEGERVVLGSRPVTFDWIDSGKPSAGYIAQEVEALGLERLVHKDTKNKKIKDKRSLNYSGMIPYLTACIQGMDRRIRQLEGQSRKRKAGASDGGDDKRR